MEIKRKPSKKSTTTLFQMLNDSNSISKFLDNYDAELEPIEFVDDLNKLVFDKKYTITDVMDDQGSCATYTGLFAMPAIP